MGLGRAIGHPDYSASGTSRFIPELWSGKLVEKLYDATVFAAISNTDYQGEIGDVGDKIYIRTRATVAIKDYVKGQTLTYEKLESPNIEMVIDKGKYFGFAIDDVDAYQSDLALMDLWAEDAAEQMKIVIDTDVLTNLNLDVSAFNRGLTAGRKSLSYNLGVFATPLQVTKTSVLDMLIDCGSVMDEQNVPETGRWFIIPTWMAGLIKKSDLKDASLTGDGKSILRNGRIGMIDRWELYSSNNIYSVPDGAVRGYYSHFGDMGALTFASQMTKVQHIPTPESTFAEIVRGLNVYGYKTINNARIGTAYIYK